MAARGKLGLIAGGGALPLAVAARCEAEGRDQHVIRLAGFADLHLARYPGIEAGMAEIGRILSEMKSAGCQVVCLAGTVSRPDFKTLRPDIKGATLLPGIRDGIEGLEFIDACIRSARADSAWVETGHG